MANLLPNPSFDTDTSGWQGLHSATIVRASDGFCRVTATQTSTPSGLITSSPVAVTGGTSYVLSANIRPDTARVCTLEIDWSDASGSYISTMWQTVPYPLAANTWVALSFGLTAPANATGATVYLDSPMAVGSVLDVDNVSFGLPPVAAPMARQAATAPGSSPEPQYRLFLADGKTGQIMGDLPYTGVPSWSRKLNDDGELTATVPLSPYIDDDMKQRLMEPWRWILGYSVGQSVRQAVYLTSATGDDTQGNPATSLSGKGMWGFFDAKRLTTYAGTSLQNDDSNIVFGPDSPDTANQALSLHSIARRLVEIATTDDGRKLQLPLTLPDPIAGSNVRTYTAADLAPIGQRLTELTQVINGPEVEFSPEFTDDTQSYITFRMRIGNTRLGQLGFPHTWDHGAALMSMPVSMDGTDMTFYVFAKGQDDRQADDTTGEVTGSLTWAYTKIDTPYPDAGWPFLFTADTEHSDVTEQDTIQGYADADVQTGQYPVYTATAVVRNDGRDNLNRQTSSPSVDELSVGDTGVVTITSHPWLAAGDYGVRILEMASGSDAYTTSLTLQILPGGQQ